MLLRRAGLTASAGLSCLLFTETCQLLNSYVETITPSPASGIGDGWSGLGSILELVGSPVDLGIHSSRTSLFNEETKQNHALCMIW